MVDISVLCKNIPTVASVVIDTACGLLLSLYTLELCMLCVLSILVVYKCTYTYIYIPCAADHECEILCLVWILCTIGYLKRALCLRDDVNQQTPKLQE